MGNDIRRSFAALAAAGVGVVLLLVPGAASARPTVGPAVCPQVGAGSPIDPDSCGSGPQDCDLFIWLPAKSEGLVFERADLNCASTATSMSILVDLEWRANASSPWQLKGRHSRSRSNVSSIDVTAEAPCLTGHWRGVASASVAGGNSYRTDSGAVNITC
jgi:hypothetical protein